MFTANYLQERAAYIEKKVAQQTETMHLDAHSRDTLRSMLLKEYDFEMRQQVREDSNSEAVEGI